MRKRDVVNSEICELKMDGFQSLFSSSYTRKPISCDKNGCTYQECTTYENNVEKCEDGGSVSPFSTVYYWLTIIPLAGYIIASLLLIQFVEYEWLKDIRAFKLISGLDKYNVPTKNFMRNILIMNGLFLIPIVILFIVGMTISTTGFAKWFALFLGFGLIVSFIFMSYYAGKIKEQYNIVPAANRNDITDAEWVAFLANPEAAKNLDTNVKIVKWTSLGISAFSGLLIFAIVYEHGHPKNSRFEELTQKFEVNEKNRMIKENAEAVENKSRLEALKQQIEGKDVELEAAIVSQASAAQEAKIAREQALKTQEDLIKARAKK